MGAEGNGPGEATRTAPSPENVRQVPRPGHPAAQVRGVLAERVVVSTALDPLLSLKALAEYSSLSVRTLRGFTELPPDQALPCYRLPGKMLVRRSTFDTWLERYQTRGRPSLVKALRELGLASESRRR